MASFTSPAILRTPALRNKLRRCVSTVATDTPKAVAIWAEVCSAAIRSRICCWRLVRVMAVCLQTGSCLNQDIVVFRAFGYIVFSVYENTKLIDVAECIWSSERSTRKPKGSYSGSARSQIRYCSYYLTQGIPTRIGRCFTIGINPKEGGICRAVVFDPDDKSIRCFIPHYASNPQIGSVAGLLGGCV